MAVAVTVAVAVVRCMGMTDRQAGREIVAWLVTMCHARNLTLAKGVLENEE